MCLYKDKKHHPFNRPLVAEEDIICYKQLETVYLTDRYVTPYTYSMVPTDCLNEKVPFKAEIINKAQFIWRHILGFSNVVTDGFIHSCVDNLPPCFPHTTFKCIIPKGTKYFVGEHRDYASEQIIFVEQFRNKPSNQGWR